MTVNELQVELEGASPPIVLDIRESHELEVSALPNVLHVPMSELADRLDDIPLDADLVVLCRVGSRSARVTAFLLGQGFETVRNVEGGINEWARQIDPSLEQY
jgi:sulfur-carrier protein adenylyltransferase/sulfurtransferase